MGGCTGCAGGRRKGDGFIRITFYCSLRHAVGNAEIDRHGSFGRENDLDRAVAGGADGEAVAALYHGGTAGGHFIAGGIVTLGRRGGNGASADGHGTPCGVVGVSGNGNCGSASGGLTGGRLHIAGRCQAKHEPGKLRIVNEHIAIALNILYLVVALHFPLVHRVLLTPPEQCRTVFDDAIAAVAAVITVQSGKVFTRYIGIEIGLLPTAIDIEQDARYVAFDVVPHLKHIVKVLGACPDHVHIIDLIGTVGRAGADKVGKGVIALGLVDTGDGGAQMVQIGAAVELVVGGFALRPHMLPVHDQTADGGIVSQHVGVEIKVGGRTGFGVGIAPVICQRRSAGAGIDHLRVISGAAHQVVQRRIQWVALSGGVGIGAVHAA